MIEPGRSDHDERAGRADGEQEAADPVTAGRNGVVSHEYHEAVGTNVSRAGAVRWWTGDNKTPAAEW